MHSLFLEQSRRFEQTCKRFGSTTPAPPKREQRVVEGGPRPESPTGQLAARQIPTCSAIGGGSPPLGGCRARKSKLE